MTQSRYSSLISTLAISTVANLSITYLANAKTTEHESNFYFIGTTSKTDFDKSNTNVMLCRRYARNGFKQAFNDYSYAHQYQTCCTNKLTHTIICH